MDQPASSSLYVHVPFCTTKCGYCDFYSVPLEDRQTEPLIAAMLAELETRASEIDPAPSTIFVGGGTPTVLPVEQLARLFDALGQLGHRGEFTVEANPATLTEANVAILRDAGVNRISLGAQSFDPAELAILERIHDPSHVADGASIAREAGIDDINLDLIFGVPGQTLASWLNSLERATQLNPAHLACYGLTYEPGTPLAAQRQRGQIGPCDEDLEAEMMLACRRRLQAEGLEHYEISNYARPGHRCRHNMRYWKNLDHVGIGPSAAGYRNGRRCKNVSDVETYVRMIEQTGRAVVEQETLSPGQRAGETAMLNLRLIEGIEIDEFEIRCGFDPTELFERPIARHVAGGLLAVDANSIRLTEEGLLLADSVIADFLHAATSV